MKVAKEYLVLDLARWGIFAGASLHCAFDILLGTFAVGSRHLFLDAPVTGRCATRLFPGRHQRVGCGCLASGPAALVSRAFGKPP